MDIDYMKAVESGDMETAQRMVDEAAEQAMKNSAIRDNKGKLLKVYHGTEAEFNSFNDPRHTPNGEAGAFFFSPWRSKSEEYGDNVRAFYLNIERPRLLDYDFNELNPNEEEVDGEIYTPEDLKEEIDQSKQGDAEIIAYYPDQIKSADPVTYDDNGKVIPLSERFNLENDDVRYSVPETDSTGRELSEGQKIYFKDSKVRDENGNLKTVYHGTNRAGFTVFNRNQNFYSDSREIAETYTNKEGIYEGYLNITNPFIVDVNGEKWSRIDVSQIEPAIVELFNEYGVSTFEEDGAERTSTADIVGVIEDAIDDGFFDYDGVIFKNIYDEGMYGNVESGTIKSEVYVTFNSNQFKNADNLNPTEDTDIRFSMKEPVEETKDLIAVHNIHEHKLLAAFKLGGFPMPSIAVTKDNVNHDGFGPISVLFDKSTIDPKANRYNRVYGGDAYTPTFPTVYYEASEKAVERISGKINEFYNMLPDFYQRDVRALRDSTNIEDQLNREGEDGFIEKYLKNYGLKQIYLAETDEIVPIVKKEVRKEMTDYQKSLYQKYVDNLGEEAIKSSKGAGLTGRDWFDKYGEQIKNAYVEWLVNDGFTEEEGRDIVDSEKPVYWVRQARFAADYLNTGGVQIDVTEDILSTQDMIDKKINVEDFNVWVRDLFDGIVERSGIRNNKDTFTPSGNRRSFKALHDTVTIDNIIKAMRGEELQTGGTFMGIANIEGASSREYNSIEDIKADSGRLYEVDMDERKESEEYIKETIEDLGLRYANGKDYFDARNTLVEAVANNESRRGIANYLKQYDAFYEYEDSIVDELIELRDYIRGLPTKYFEAKPRRAVTFDEIKAVIIPDDSSNELKTALDDKSIEYVEYEAGNEEDRKAKVNDAATEKNIKFSISENLDADLESVLRNKFPKGTSEVYIGETSNFLTNVIGVRAKTNVMPPRKAYAAMVSEEKAKEDGRYDYRLNYHDLGKEKLIKVLESAEKPIAAVVSKEDENGEKRYDRIMLITDEVDSDGNNIVVIEQVDSEGLLEKKRVKTNRTITTYGKEYIQGVIQDAVASDTVLYYQKNKISTIARREEVQFLNRKSSAYFNTNIDNFWANVNWGKQKKQYSIPDIDDVNDYVNMRETEFVEVPPVRDYEKTSASVRTKSVEELQRQVELLQNDKKLTHGKLLNKSSVREQMNILVRTLMSHSEGTTKKTDSKLVKVAVENAERIFKAVKEDNIVDASNTAYYAAREIVENLKLVNDDMFQEYKELRKFLRTTAVTISEEDRTSITDFKEFRRENMGRLRIVNEGGMAVDDLYANLCEVYPELFDPEITHPADQLIAMADVRAQMEPYDVMLSAETTEQLIKETAHDLLEISIKGKPWKSWADRRQEAYEEKIKQLKARHTEALHEYKTKMKDKADERVKAERSKANDRVKAERKKGKEQAGEKVKAERWIANERVEGERIANARKQAEQKRLQQEAKERKYAEAEKRRHISRIEKDLKWLSDRLLKPTDDKHLPDGYQQAIAQMLMMVDPQTERSKKLEKKYGPSKKRANFLRLKAEYEKIAQSEAEGMIYNEDISNWCEELAKTLDDAGSIAEATVEEMRLIRQLVRAVAHSIREQNKAFDEELKAGISELATETIHKAKTSRKTGQRGGIPGALGTLLNESMVTPRDFFEGIGGGLQKAFMSIRKGHDKHVNNMTEARTFFAELFGEYANKKKPGSEIEKWRNHKTNETFDLEGGPITMNVAQKMSLYCLLKREQAAGHIYGSGIVVAEASHMNKLKEALGAKKELNYGTTRITMEEAYNIISTLSQEQIEMAEKLQSFLNGPCAQWGNETSMKMYGYKKFTEPNYFPIQSADVYLESNFEGRQTVERIRNFGFTKGTVVNANNPIVIDDIFTVVADHVNKMSMYNAFAAPIADFTRVYNYKTRDEAGLVLESTKDALANTYGKKVGRYINNFIADLQSNTQTRQEGFTRFVNKTLANYKKATIAANIRVALQQPTAIIRAFTLIDPKYFVLKNHTPELIKKAKGEDTDYKDMLEHCPIARWKSWGFSQVDMARDIDDIMMNKEWSRLDLVTMQIYGVLDLYTWSKIWGAVRAETKAKHPEVEVNSEEFYAICNERASEVFDKTQVVDSVIHRSQVMRNTDTMSKVLTSFMAEPTRTYNMVRSEYAVAMDLWAEGKKGEASKKVARASSVYLLNALVCAMAAAVADALRGKDLDDDDEPEDWRELTWANFMSNANPLNLLPVFKEVPSIWQGWDTSNMALEGVEALVKAEKGILDKMRGESDKEWSELIRKQAEAMGLVFGVPVKNILREVETWGNMVGLNVFAAEVGSEEEKKFELNLVADGSGFDNFLNHVGINLTEKERLARDFDGTVNKLNKATKNMTEAEKQEYLWKEITENYTKAIESGNYDVLENMSNLLEATGGDYQKFQESVVSKTKTAMKKSIGVDSMATENYREQLKKMGYTDAQINQEVIMKSDAAKAFQLEACEDDYDGMVETIRTLYDAGLTEMELDVLYYNRTKAINANDYQTGTFVAPCNGEITSTFGYRNAPTAGASSNHQGIDIGVPANSDIAAADGGKVSSVGYSSGYGNYVKISHGNGRYTFYAHLNGYYVQKGQAVNKGDVIALSGSTGISTGPHLHFEVIENGVNVDPMNYL